MSTQNKQPFIKALQTCSQAHKHFPLSPRSLSLRRGVSVRLGDGETFEHWCNVASPWATLLQYGYVTRVSCTDKRWCTGILVTNNRFFYVSNSERKKRKRSKGNGNGMVANSKMHMFVCGLNVCVFVCVFEWAGRKMLAMRWNMWVVSRDERNGNSIKTFTKVREKDENNTFSITHQDR